MINVCEREILGESLGVGESWEKWELSELDEKCISVWDGCGCCKINWNSSLLYSSSI